MSKLLLTALTLVLIAAGATVVLAATGDGGSSPATVDLSGPCDEAEHATDPACAGTAAGDDRDGDDRGRDHAEDDGVGDDRGDDNPSADDLSGVDLSGNCDEAEHAADPECAGVAPMTATTTAIDDDTDEFEDNSGPSENSGPDSTSSGSSSSSGADNSGPGGGGGD